MATVTLNHVQFWQPPSKPSFRNQRISPVQQNGGSATATNSRNQPVPQYQNANPSSKRSDQSNYSVAAARGHDSIAQLVPDRVKAQGTIQENITGKNSSNPLWKTQNTSMAPKLATTLQTMNYHLWKISHLHLCVKRFRQKNAPPSIPRNGLSTQMEAIAVYHSLN
ncbi:hypothetical protein BGZ57DRAFT_609656 [Hyaloscypha finlandica]|nr:hypothetical protein BGZ57DRAFT_609656 [Hyaloscypha finlandica]